MTQVGIIFVEIGCGLRYIALIHILGHGCLRTLQFVRAPTLLHDYRVMVNAIGAEPGGPMTLHQSQTPGRFGMWLYRFGMERAWLDEWLMTLIVRPFVRCFETCDALERRWTNLLSGGESRESEHVTPATNSLDELL